MNIRWRNRFSNETGFVKSVSKKEKHFNNTFNQAEAHTYKDEQSAVKVIELLVSFGEGENNEFEIVPAVA